MRCLRKLFGLSSEAFRTKLLISFFCPSIPKRDLDTKKTTPNIEVCPESLGVIYQIKRGLSSLKRRKTFPA